MLLLQEHHDHENLIFYSVENKEITYTSRKEHNLTLKDCIHINGIYTEIVNKLVLLYRYKGDIFLEEYNGFSEKVSDNEILLSKIKRRYKKGFFEFSLFKIELRFRNLILKKSLLYKIRYPLPVDDHHTYFMIEMDSGIGDYEDFFLNVARIVNSDEGKWFYKSPEYDEMKIESNGKLP